MPKTQIKTSDVKLKLHRKSSRAMRLHEIKKRAREIRQQHANGDITAEEAAHKLRELHAHRHGFFFNSKEAKAQA